MLGQPQVAGIGEAVCEQLIHPRCQATPGDLHRAADRCFVPLVAYAKAARSMPCTWRGSLTAPPCAVSNISLHRRSRWARRSDASLRIEAAPAKPRPRWMEYTVSPRLHKS